MVIFFFCLVPVRILLSSVADFAPREWLPAKGLKKSCPARLYPPGTKFSTGIASRVIKSHKPPHHVKAQHLGREHTAVGLYIVSTNAYNHFPRKLPLVKLTNLAWLYCQSFYLIFIPSPFVCILLYKHRNCFNLFRKRNQDCWKRRKEIG